MALEAGPQPGLRPAAHQGEGGPHRLRGRAPGHRRPARQRRGAAGQGTAGAGGRRLPPLRPPRRGQVQGEQGQPPGPPDEPPPAGPGLFGKRSILGVREAAALWHPPGERDETPLVERSGSRALLPSARSVSGGALVGATTAGTSQPIRFPEDLLRRHHLYVARTRMGKSTLMHHIVTHKLREKAEGRDGDAIVVVDPHADLVAGIPGTRPGVPHRPGAAHRPGRRDPLSRHQPAGHPRLRRPRPHRRLGGAGGQGPVGAVGSPDAVHPGADGQDPPRGQRAGGSRPAAHHPGRAEAPVQRAPSATRCWPRSRTPTCWSGGPGTSAAGTASTGPRPWRRCRPGSPTTHRPKGRGPSWASPAPPSTWRETILEGGVLLVSTSQGTVGRDVAALVGGVAAQPGGLGDQGAGRACPFPSAAARWWWWTRCSPCPAWITKVDVQSELGKFGASFILATQSLAKLEDLSHHHARHACWPTWAAWPCSRWPETTPVNWCGSWARTG